jgi:hypothetical protein
MGGFMLPATAAQTTAQGDLVVAELRRQLRTGVQRIGGLKPGEGARSVASTLAVGVAYMRANNVDRGLQAALQRSVRRSGREAVIGRDIDRAHLAHLLRDYGVTDAALPPLADYATRDRALAALLRPNGFSTLVSTAARGLAGASADLDRIGGVIRPIRQSRDCEQWKEDMDIWSAIVTIVCSAAALAVPGGELACAFATGLLAGYLLIYWINCR